MEVEIIDLETANIVASFGSETEALALVRDAITRHGERYVSTWALGRLDRSAAPVSGAALATLARTVAA